ncbi:AAA family ATPase [Bacillus thuringiensis]|uniref:AAA family ATPase n=1 Tax=Bacillus thuringiensis TaxID=1428 RepID=UPI0020C34C88|nr:AAA family ATPase [Bacillus thuringiensis]
MILESIILRNFRQYFSSQIIEFSQSNTRNVTVIHGENGAGKTALLNAFSWCLYGELNLPNTSNIINEHAVNELEDGEEVEAFVTIQFKEKVKGSVAYEKHYSLTRSIKARKISEEQISYSEPEVRLEYREDGQSKLEVANIGIEINRILPEQLSSYFFFDGERIDNLSKESGTEEVKEAIKTMMGLEILERSILHTEGARKRFLTELKQYGDVETRNLVEEIENLHGQKEDLESEEKEFKQYHKSIEKQIKEKEERLRQIEDSKHLQEQRDVKTKELNTSEEELVSIRKGLADLMSKQGYLAFSFLAIDKARDVLANKNLNNNTYTGINASFLDQLIIQEECICGTHLITGSAEYNKVIDTKNYLAPISLEHAIAEFQSDIKITKDRKQKLFEGMGQLRLQESNFKQKIRLLNEEIEEIGKKISDKDSEEIVNLENVREQLIIKKSQIDQRMGGIQHQLNEISEKLDKKNNERQKLNQKVEKAAVTERRIKACEEVIEVMKEIYKLREKIVKEQLQERVAKVYTKFLRKDYKIRLSNDYKLDVINGNGNKVGMSQGERQITSLSFIGAIVDIAREQFNQKNINRFEEGGIYPIVMDSPFGALDSDHRERIAKGIPELSDQVIVIVSTSQWQGEVEEKMRDKIGKEYRLIYNDPRINKEKNYEFTEITEVVTK